MARSRNAKANARSAGGYAATNKPVNSVAPAITGTATEGETLSLSNGTWSNTPDAYAYIWKRDGVVIAGASAATYELTEDDVDAVITASVRATNLGVSAVANSNATDAVAAA
jgi:hypothetical protein